MTAASAAATHVPEVTSISPSAGFLTCVGLTLLALYFLFKDHSSRVCEQCYENVGFERDECPQCDDDEFHVIKRDRLIDRIAALRTRDR